MVADVFWSLEVEYYLGYVVEMGEEKTFEKRA